MKTKWKPTKETIILAFGELANGVGSIGLPQSERDLVTNMCFARRDLQLALLGYGKKPDKRKRLAV